MHWRDAVQDTLQNVINQPHLGLVTDMDGTISPIVSDPGAAEVTPRNRELLAALHPHLSLIAVVSGRAVTDVRQRVDVPELLYIGNHGLEWWTGEQVEITPQVQMYRPALESALDAVGSIPIPGILVEDKGETLSIHYRQTSDPRAVEAELTPTIGHIAQQQGLRLFKGRMVFELRPPVAINKGSVFRDLVDRYHLDAAFYLGDDTTDADALQMARQMRQDNVCDAFGLGVISAETPDSVRSSADLSLSGVADVEAFLDWLFKARSASST